jgi:hypothetical protein
MCACDKLAKNDRQCAYGAQDVPKTTRVPQQQWTVRRALAMQRIRPERIKNRIV